MQENRDLTLARTIAQAAAGQGGRAYFVGGYVRDLLMGNECKDIDIEVHGISYEALSDILDTVGEKTVMGVSFGVFGLRHSNLDIAMPRMEKATGRGHKDFSVSVDPFIGTEQAAKRRDFTINAMMQDVLTGGIIDHFGGREDLRRGILRHVNDATFVEDPLRALRAAQFASRFGFAIDPGTRAICSEMDLSYLARERVYQEMSKAFEKAPKPSIFFEEMRAMGQLDCWWPELAALIGVEQNPLYHPEGDVWTHTMLVLDEAAAERNEAKYPEGLCMAALCHDLGKPATTKRDENGVLHAIMHEIVGVRIAERLIERLTSEEKLRRYVADMVKKHMRPNMLYSQKAGDKAYMRLYDESICPEDLLLLARADRLAQKIDPVEYIPVREKSNAMLARYRELCLMPCVRGEDLLRAGIKPGKEMGELLSYAHDLHLSGIPYEDALARVLAFAEKRNKSKTDL